MWFDFNFVDLLMKLDDAGDIRAFAWITLGYLQHHNTTSRLFMVRIYISYVYWTTEKRRSLV